MDNLWLNTNYTAYDDNVYKVNSTASYAVQQMAGNAVVSSVGYNLIYDTRNNRKNPTSGIYLSWAQDCRGAWRRHRLHPLRSPKSGDTIR